MIIEKYLGLLEYQKAYQEQLSYHQLVQTNPEDIYLLGLEHPDVITLGHRADIEVEVKKTHFLPLERTDRGGLATIHSRGQLVIYPIMNLRKNFVGVRNYVSFLLEISKATFLKYKVETYIDSDNIGLYTEIGKIGFCGLHISQGCSLHGLSLNLKNDLSLFDQIQSCGVSQPKLDRLSRIYPDIQLQDFFELWKLEFKEQIGGLS